MVSEKLLMKFFLFEIKYDISYKGVKFVIHPVLIINNLIVMLSMSLHLNMLVIVMSKTMGYLIILLSALPMLCIFVKYMVKTFLKEETAKAVYKDITDHDAEIGLLTDERSDWLMLALLGVYPLMSLLSTYMLYVAEELDLKHLVAKYGTMVTKLNIYALVIVKHVIVKRLINIESMEDIGKVILNTRLAFNWNNRINHSFRMQATLYAIHIFMYGLHVYHSMWAIHVVKLQVPGAHENYIVPSVFESMGNILILYLLCYFDSLVTDQVC